MAQVGVGRRGASARPSCSRLHLCLTSTACSSAAGQCCRRRGGPSPDSTAPTVRPAFAGLGLSHVHLVPADGDCRRIAATTTKHAGMCPHIMYAAKTAKRSRCAVRPLIRKAGACGASVLPHGAQRKDMAMRAPCLNPVSICRHRAAAAVPSVLPDQRRRRDGGGQGGGAQRVAGRQRRRRPGVRLVSPLDTCYTMTPSAPQTPLPDAAG